MCDKAVLICGTKTDEAVLVNNIKKQDAPESGERSSVVRTATFPLPAGYPLLTLSHNFTI